MSADTIDDLAERIGRLATKEMLVTSAFERSQVEIGGSHAAFVVLEAAQDQFDSDAFGGFVERLLDGVAQYEEMAT
jgi:hypothetical protein